MAVANKTSHKNTESEHCTFRAIRHDLLATKQETTKQIVVKRVRMMQRKKLQTRMYL